MIAHHPSDETLAGFAGGGLDEARALVVAAHLSSCRQCRASLRAAEEAAGAWLSDGEPAGMAEDALERALERVGSAARTPQTSVAAGDPLSPLDRYERGPWRRLGLGVHWRSVAVPAPDDCRVFLLKAAGGTRLPAHRHLGSEWTCVFEGAFRHEGGRYGPGDFDEADETVAHHPRVEDGQDCVCLVALQGGIALQGWIGRMLQPLVRL